MNQAPAHLYTRQDDIARMEALVLQLPDEAVVELHLADGGSITGVVTTRPSVQVFRDSDGHEGFNAVVRIDKLDNRYWMRYFDKARRLFTDEGHLTVAARSAPGDTGRF